MSDRKRPCQSCRYHAKQPGAHWECWGCGEWVVRDGKAVRP